MEGIYSVESYPHVSHRFNTRSYFMEYTNLLKETLYSNQAVLERLDTDEEKVAFQLGIKMDEYYQYEEQCGLAVLQCDPLEICVKEKPTDSKIMLERATRALATAVELKALKACELKYENKLRELKRTAIPQFEQEPIPSPLVRLPNNYVVIARVFMPFKSNTSLNHVPHVQDFMLLGSQKLIDFRDKIICMNEEVMVIDDLGPIKNHITSSVFFFGNTFYSDCRSVTNIDYGMVIDKWAKDNPEMCLGPFEQKKMEDNTIGDLEIRLGFPYVFIHLGNCEHIITFVDARLMVPEDLQNPDEYPLVVQSGTNLLMYCGACDVHSTSYYVDDDQMPTKPMNLCEQCFQAFYKKNNIVQPSTEDVYFRKLPIKDSVYVQPQEEMESED